MNGACKCGLGESCVCDVECIPAIQELGLTASGESQFHCGTSEVDVGRLQSNDENDKSLDSDSNNLSKSPDDSGARNDTPETRHQ